MKKIIVPIDFSKQSEYALETAAKLAKKHNAEILALHMLEISETILTKGSTELQSETLFFMKLAEKKFNEFMSKDYLTEIKITPIIKHFKVFSEVNDIAKEHNADLIIMGSHGASGIKEAFVGSNTEKVVRHSDVPVLVIKKEPVSVDFDTVVFACDFTKEAIKPYQKATTLFKSLGSKIHLVYVNLPNENFMSTTKMKSQVFNFLEKADGHLDHLKQVHYVNDYTVEKGVLNFANDIDADLIAIATHGRTGISHFFAGSISEDLANHAHKPVMTFKI